MEDSFDPKSYAHTIIQSRVVGESLAKLADGVSLLDKELHDQVGFAPSFVFVQQWCKLGYDVPGCILCKAHAGVM